MKLLFFRFPFYFVFHWFVFQVLCNVLWYITNQHTVIQDASLREKNVLPIPYCYDEYSGYNDVKRKKIKEAPLSSATLRSHSQSIYRYKFQLNVEVFFPNYNAMVVYRASIVIGQNLLSNAPLRV